MSTQRGAFGRISSLWRGVGKCKTPWSMSLDVSVPVHGDFLGFFSCTYMVGIHFGLYSFWSCCGQIVFGHHCWPISSCDKILGQAVYIHICEGKLRGFQDGRRWVWSFLLDVTWKDEYRAWRLLPPLSLVRQNDLWESCTHSFLLDVQGPRWPGTFPSQPSTGAA